MSRKNFANLESQSLHFYILMHLNLGLQASVMSVKLYLVLSLNFISRWLARMNGHGRSHSHSHGHGHSQNQSADGKKTGNDLKVALFHQLTTQMISLVPELKGLDSGIRILEIGVGTGVNFRFFPKKCLFIAVDPNPQFESSVMENLQKVQLKLYYVMCQQNASNVRYIYSN